MKSFPILLGFLKKELLQTLRDPRMRIVLFVAPVFQLTLFGLALSNEVKNIRIAAWHKPNDQVAKHIVQKSLASGWFIPASTTGEDPYEWLRSGQAEVVLISRKEADREIQLLINASNVLRAQATENYIRAIAMEVTTNPSLTSPPSLLFDVRPLFNPTFETSIYMVPGVMSMLACMVTIILTSMSVAREKEFGTIETLISAPLSGSEILAGKTVPFIILGLIQIPLILTAAVILFGVPIRGSLLLLALASFFFVLTTVAIGILISTIANNQQQAMLGGFIFLFPAVLLSGLMFPIENIPLPLWVMAQINPLTHFIGLLRNIMLKGGQLDYVLFHSVVLAGISIIVLWLASRRFKTTL